MRANEPIPAVGLLSGGTEQEDAFRVDAFRQGIGDAGFVEGRNVTLMYRGESGRYDELPALATELVRAQVAVLASLGPTLSGLAAKSARRFQSCSTSVPIRSRLALSPA